MKTGLLFSIALFVLILSACRTAAPVTKPAPLPAPAKVVSEYDCEHNGTLTAEERLSASLFGKAAKVQVVAFSNKVVTALPVDKNTIAYKYIKETVTLTAAQIDELTDVFYNYNYSDTLTSKAERHGLCYFPRHAVVFLDSLDRVLGYFEVCFECENHKIRPADENFGEFCLGKYDLLEACFTSFGITFFKEEDE